MGKRVTDINEVIWQKSISFPFRVKKFLMEFPEFNIHKFCQVAVDEQIALIKPEYLKDEKTAK